MSLLQKASLPESWAGRSFCPTGPVGGRRAGEASVLCPKTGPLTYRRSEDKLDRLVSGFLDGIIDRDTYLEEERPADQTKDRDLEQRSGRFWGKGEAGGSNPCGNGWRPLTRPESLPFRTIIPE